MKKKLMAGVIALIMCYTVVVAAANSMNYKVKAASGSGIITPLYSDDPPSLR